MVVKRRQWDSNPRITVLQTVAQNLQSQEKQKLTDSADKCLQTSLQTKSENSPKSTKNQVQKLPADLAEIIAVWPELPEHIKAVIKAPMKSSKSSNKIFFASFFVSRASITLAVSSHL